MGYLDPYLLDNKSQTVSCDDLYQLWLKVKHPEGTDRITAADTQYKVGNLVKSIIPDVEDWQYAGDLNSFYIFKFHRNSQRQEVKDFMESLGYETATRDVLA